MAGSGVDDDKGQLKFYLYFYELAAQPVPVYSLPIKSRKNADEVAAWNASAFRLKWKQQF